jgi:hypothetical protein
MRANTVANSFFRDIPRASQQQIITAVGRGASLRNAAKLARVTFVLLKQYFQYADQQLSSPHYNPEDYSVPELELFSFFQAVQYQEAQYEQSHIDILSASAADDWKAAAHILKQKNPEDWGPAPASAAQSATSSTNQQLTGPNPLLSGHNIDLKRLTSDELVTLEALITKATVQPIDVIEAAREAPKLLSGPDKIVLG